MNKKNKILLFIASGALVLSPFLVFASQSSSPSTGTSLSQISVTVSGSQDRARIILADPNGNIVGDTHSAPNSAFPYPGSDGTFTATALWGSLTNSPLGTYTILSTNQSNTGANTCSVGNSTLSTCLSTIAGGSGYYTESTFILTAAAAGVPTVGTTDIAAVSSPIFGAFISNSEYVLETFGPPLFVILLVFAVFFAIYHRVKVGHWL